ncbi:MAG: tetratricopeptide repeat protein [Planctomycetaceae bacterium]|jgi:tetratricopeptide (TPR) repeat protein|nr:tetratricopeptide repeat protein [Planctomycetaceae bacterium]
MFNLSKTYAKAQNIIDVLCLLFLMLSVILSSCTNMTTDGRNHQGIKHYQQMRYDQAISEFQNAVSQSPDSPEGYYYIGMTYHTLGTSRNAAAYYGQAEQYYKLCLTKNPNYAPCREKYAELMLETGRTAEAFTFLRDWEVASKDLATPKIAMAKLYQQAGRPQDAFIYLNAAVQKEPQNFAVYNALGNLRESLGELTQALENYQLSYQFNPQQPEIADKIARLTSPSSTTMPGVTVVKQTSAVSDHSSASSQDFNSLNNTQTFRPAPQYNTPTRIASRNRHDF